MRQYQFPKVGSIDDLKLVSVPDPTPGHGQVLVRLRAVSLNYRDLMIAEDRYGNRGTRPNLVPASDGAGEVLAIGDGVTRANVGDRVAGIFHQHYLGGEVRDESLASALGGDLDGVLTEKRVFDQDGLVNIPDRLSFEQAATLPCAAVTTWNALQGTRPVRAGDTVLTQGTGGVSVFAIQFATVSGARVIATSSSDKKLKRAKELGATDGINYRTHENWDAEVMRLTAGRGVDAVLDVGGPGTLGMSLKCIALGGTINVIGLLGGGGGQINPLVLIPRAASLRGIYVGSRDMFDAMNRAIEVNAIEPVIDRVFDFQNAAEAYRHLKSGAHFGKVVIRI